MDSEEIAGLARFELEQLYSARYFKLTVLFDFLRYFKPF